MKEFFTVRCPYCFQPLRYNNAVFRRTDGPMATDKYLEIYHHDRSNFAYEENIFDYVDPGDPKYKGRKFLDKNGYIIELENPSNSSGINLTQRLCPFCHNDLLDNFGRAKTKYIAVIGVSASGKTTFLSAINNQLRENSKFTWMTMSAKASKSLEGITEKYREASDKARVSTKDINGPFFYRLDYSGSQKPDPRTETDVVFFDVPGEYYAKSEKINRQLQDYLTYADGIIFIVNSAEKIERAEAIHNGNESEEPVTVINILEALYESKILKNRRESLKTAIVFNKIDKVEDDFNLFGGEEWQPPTIEDAIDFDEIEAYSYRIKEAMLGNGGTQTPLQKELSAYMRKIIDVFGEDCPVFATKLITEIYGGKYRFNSSGADTPFLWLLAKMGAFPVKQEKKKQ